MNDAVPAWRSLADRFWEQLKELDPIIGTEVGDERYDDRLPDPTEAGLARREAVHRDALESLLSLDRTQLDRNARTTLDILEAIARRELDDIAYRFDRLNAVSHLLGPSSLLATIASLQLADTPERVERFAGRLSAFPAYLDAVGEVAREGVDQGQTVPAIVAERAVAQVERLLALDVRDSPGMAPVANASEEERERVDRILREEVWPAFERYLGVLRDYLPSARSSIGLSALPRGDEMYAAQVRAWTSLTLSPEVIHEIGVRDLEKIEEDRRAIAESLGHPDAATAIAEYSASGRNTPSTPEDIVRLAEEQVTRGWEASPKFFGHRPTGRCEVKAVERFREKDMPFAFYFPPTQDGSRPGIYYVNTCDLEERTLHRLASVTYHEAIPGHHFQVCIEQEIEASHDIRRFAGIFAGSAFIEGWGLYSERLADEMGLYLDEYERLGMLEAQGLRAARLVVDTGIHALGWDRDRCIATLEATGASTVDAVIETDRYIATPGQALAYKLGQIEIERWRAEAAERDGARFSLSDFHDHLLAVGSLPLPALERELAAADD